MSPPQFEVWVVYAQRRRASHARETVDENEQESGNRAELDGGTVLIGLQCGTFSRILVE